MKPRKWFELDNPTMGQGHESYWGLQAEMSDYDKKKLAEHEENIALDKEAEMRAVERNRAYAAPTPELDFSPMSDEEFDQIKDSIMNDEGLMGKARTEEEKKLYLRNFYGL